MRSVRPIPAEILEEIYRDDPPAAEDTPPPLFVIALAWCAGLALIATLWTGRLF